MMGAGLRASVLIDLIKEVDAEYIAEIGVAKGSTARIILRSGCADTIKEYWAIDPWSTKYTGKSRGWGQGILDKQAWHVYKYMCFFPQLRIVQMPSKKASNLFVHHKKYIEGEYFDLVFIDANHEYKNTKVDILAWQPLVRKGGIICGHDYASRELGVIQAVNEIYGKDNFEVIQPGSIWVKRIL